MLTLLVRLLLLAEIAVYLALGSWILALAIALGARLALVLLTSLHGWLHRSPRIPEHRLHVAGTVRLLATEYLALLADNFFYLPFERQAVRRDPVPAQGSAVPVILVHGYLSNRGYFRPMVRWLEARGVTNVFVPDYRSVFSTIESGVATLHAEVERIFAGTGQRVVLVCHSMGGLVARRYLQDHGEGKVARLVTIASPHHGTELARIGIGGHARQMERGSPFLDALARAEAAKPPSVPTLSIYTLHDNLVSPQETSRLGWARNVAISGVSHVGILASREAFELVLEELKAAGAA